MNTEYNDPGNDRDAHKFDKEEQMGDTPGIDAESKTDLAPNKDQKFKVLNPDGSLPDMPEEDVEGKGALDGTVGLGT